jgi:hypothetical protein
MNDEIKILIINFLIKNHGKKYSVKNLYDNFIILYPNFKTSYSTFLRYIDVLIAEKKIKSEDFGFVRFVWD